MLTIKVLGPGCANCRKLEQVALQAAKDAGIEAEVVKVTDLQEIIAHGVYKTPGLWIGGKLVSTGTIPAPGTVARWILDAA